METIEYGQAAFVALLALIALSLAKVYGYFRLPSPSVVPVRLRQVVGAFTVYFFSGFFLFPVLILLYRGGRGITTLQAGWLQITSLTAVFIFLIGYCFLIEKKARRFIFCGESQITLKRFFKSIGMGALSWLIAYPLVLLVSFLLGLVIQAFWGEIEFQQLAVKQLRKVMQYPLLFSVMVLFVTLIVPFMEELLFRGFLQSYLTRRIGRIGSICTTAAVFALVHFSISQGVGNIQLIGSLFVLALFLGWVYEREKTLIAPIAMHGVFNALSVALLFFGVE